MLRLLELATYFLIFNPITFVNSVALPQDLNNDGDGVPQLIGDLTTAITSPVGQSIANILLGSEDGQSSVMGTNPGPSCKTSTDRCCIWYQVAADLTKTFTGPTGRCNDMARAAIRLGFHDAGTWSQALANAGQDYGGADGSFVLFNEIFRSENRGLEIITVYTFLLQKKYGVGMADLIQFMANHATVTCPLGPRVRTFIGRKDATRAAPNGLLPSMLSDSNTLIALFQDKTISPHDLTALLGAHSTSRQFAQDFTQFGKPQDSTPGVWDVSFFNETVQPAPIKGVFRFPSDVAISQDPRSSNEWQAFIGDQAHWNEDYARAYVRLSLLGVNNINNLTECSAALPAAKVSFPGSSTPFIFQ